MPNPNAVADPQTVAVVVSHTHWDRAWYLTFQQFRFHLIALVDDLIELLHRDDSYRTFVLDGQTVVLEDYLAIRPERRDELAALVQSGRLWVGPWYILPDVFLVSAESLVRNLLRGGRIAQAFGARMSEGYVPDPFGHPAQLPLILRGFGLESFLFMRGLPNERTDLGSEFWWDAPDGSRVLAVYQRFDYGNMGALGFPNPFGQYAGQQPDPQAAVSRITGPTGLAGLNPLARTPFRLLANGMDHMPPQRELPALLDAARAAAPEVEFRHGTFSDLVAGIRASVPDDLPVYSGELTGNPHHPALLSVYSTRMWIKQANARCQTLLERVAEPLVGLNRLTGGSDLRAFLDEAWMELMRNHPHDDICGCSVDPVHQDNAYRFRQVEQIGEYVAHQSARSFGSKLTAAGDGGRAVLVWNGLGVGRTHAVEATILWADEVPDPFELHDETGAPVAIQLVSREPAVVMEYLDRRPGTAVRFRFLADLPPCGYRRYTLVAGTASPPAGELRIEPRAVENALVRVEIDADGSFKLTDKQTGHVTTGLNRFESTEDAGDTYTYSPVQLHSLTITSDRVQASVEVVETGPVRATLRVALELTVPARLTADRQRRSAETVGLRIVTDISLTVGSALVELQTTVDNRAEDHRLRALFPTDIATQTAHHDGHFNVIERAVVPEITADEVARLTAAYPKELPYRTRHQGAFASVDDGETGFTLANRGLPEIELLVDSSGRATLALTLLRAVGWLSRQDDIFTRQVGAGPPLPTPEAQMLGSWTFEYAVLPHIGGWLAAGAHEAAYAFGSPPVAVELLADGAGTLPPVASLVRLEPFDPSASLVLSAVKPADDGSGDLVVRVWNPTGSAQAARLHTLLPLQRAQRAELDESVAGEIGLRDPHTTWLDAPPFGVATVRLTFDPQRPISAT